jgi:hypothetical protein
MVGTSACNGLRPTGFDLASACEATALDSASNVLFKSVAAFVASFKKKRLRTLIPEVQGVPRKGAKVRHVE